MFDGVTLADRGEVIAHGFAFGANIDGEVFSLASALAHLLATKGPDRESPT